MQSNDEQSESRYFANQQDQDAVIGRLIREQRSLEARQSALNAEARRISDNLIALGKALRNPSRVALETEEVLPEFETMTQSFYRVSIEELKEIEKILPLCRDFRNTIVQFRLNAKSLEDAGWKR